MTANPWDKFYWNDWENDPALKLCSLSAQGLWMRMLCICAKADPKGYLLVAGQSLSPADLASLVGKTEAEIETLLTELTSKGVLSLDRKSRIYSRRMVRDVNKSRTARQNGRFGGNPTLWQQRENRASDNPPLKPPDKPHKPEAREFSNENSSIRTKPTSRFAYPEDFDLQFWKQYPTDELMSKKEAFKVWKRMTPDEQASAIAAVPAFRAYCSSHPDYRPVHAVRFLSQDRSSGFAEVAERTAGSIFVKRGTAQWKAWDAHYRKTTGKSPPTDSHDGWRFPSEYPPAKTSVAA